MDDGIKIKVRSLIEDSKGEVSEFVIFTEATFKKVGTKDYLMYDETEGSGLEGTKTLLTYDGDHVNIKRYGEVNSDLGIHMEMTRENFYRTPYGIFVMHTTGKRIDWESETLLRIHLTYTLFIEGEDGPSTVTIEIEELENEDTK